ncbi:hypothetical protein [Nocardioides sp. Iso805N]|uniref:hypothetical protein n=1 Tax=Nocardioides sp. Iso805N TaxID=1283287 RepID=UPI0012FB5723|nr:hypothetical protein [Nocardioides sp. Iso805N]
MRSMRRVLAVLGAVALLVGLVAGVADRQLLDTSRFVEHADRIRQDPAVARHLAVDLTDRIVQQQPDLVVVRPLLEGALQSSIRSSAFRPIFRTALAPLHQAWTGSAPTTVVLQVADVGAVLVAVSRTFLPDATQHVPTGIEVRLARFGSGSAGRSALSGMRTVRVLSWLCPLLSMLCLGGVVALSRGRRRRALGVVGVIVAGTGVTLALATVVVSFVVSRAAPDTLDGALVDAGWRELAGPLRNAGLLTAAAAYLLTVASRWAAPVLGVTAWRAWLTTMRWQELPARTRSGVAGAATGLGVLLVLEPTAMLAIAAISAGLVLALHGLATLAREAGARLLAAADGRRQHAAERTADGSAETAGQTADHTATDERSRRVRIGIVVGMALVLLSGLVVWNSSGSVASALLSADDPTACNGSPLLCDRRYDQVSFPATHNSMAAADQAGWFLAEQPDGVIDQLDAGIRGFLIDTWYGQATSRPGVIANTEATHATALAQAEAEYGADVIASALRLRQGAGLVPEGPTAAYLCHALCVLGSTKWEPLMVQVREWLQQHPRQVLTFILQDEVSPATTAQVFSAAGLMPYVYTPSAEGTWPTLEQMIDSGQRVVVMNENQGGGTRYPWQMSAFEELQDTPFDARQASDFSCRLNRGPATAPLFLVNHWLNQSLSRVSASRLANSDAVLGARLDQCQHERGLLPNFVAVDNYDQGDLFGQVLRLNGLDGGS